MPSTPTGPARVPSPVPRLGGRYFALAALFSMNLLNYVDRYSFFAVGTHVQRDLKIDDQSYGLLAAAFMIVYTIVSPLMGWLGDRYNRRYLLAAGVGLWSLATVGTAFSRGFTDMFFWRALLGVGEASYGVIAPALLADLFPPERRGRVMGVYFLALPLGGALGYGIGGWVADTWHWRLAFWVVGLPGLLAAFAALALRDPGRGASEGKAHTGPARRHGLADYLALVRTRTFLYNTAGMAAVTFASGAYAAWGSTFYQRVHGLSASDAGLRIGGLTALSGLLGIGFSTWFADVLLRYTRRAYLAWACFAVFAALVPAYLAMVATSVNASYALLFVAMFLIASVLGPCNTVTANVVPAHRRAAGYALCIFLLHVFGDISSPILIGFIANLFATAGAAGLAGGNLTAGMLSVIPVLALGGLFFLLGARHLPRDQERAQAEGGTPDAGSAFAH